MDLFPQKTHLPLDWITQILGLAIPFLWTVLGYEKLMFTSVIMSSIMPSPKPTFGEGDGTPLQYSCLENPMDGGAWWAAIHGVATSGT